MLIGSQARGTVGPLSDVDIAVWHEPDLDPSQRLALQLGLASAAAGAYLADPKLRAAAEHVFASLAYLDDLREFAAIAKQQLD